MTSQSGTDISAANNFKIFGGMSFGGTDLFTLILCNFCGTCCGVNTGIEDSQNGGTVISFFGRDAIASSPLGSMFAVP